MNSHGNVLLSEQVGCIGVPRLGASLSQGQDAGMEEIDFASTLRLPVGLLKLTQGGCIAREPEHPTCQIHRGLRLSLLVQKFLPVQEHRFAGFPCDVEPFTPKRALKARLAKISTSLL